MARWVGPIAITPGGHTVLQLAGCAEEGPSGALRSLDGQASPRVRDAPGLSKTAVLLHPLEINAHAEHAWGHLGCPVVEQWAHFYSWTPRRVRTDSPSSSLRSCPTGSGLATRGIFSRMSPWLGCVNGARCGRTPAGRDWRAAGEWMPMRLGVRGRRGWRMQLLRWCRLGLLGLKKLMSRGHFGRPGASLLAGSPRQIEMTLWAIHALEARGAGRCVLTCG